MPMTLVGQYDSPYTRRVAISLGLLGFEFDHDTRSVFGDFDSMRTTNPLGRTQAEGGLSALDAQAWPADAPLRQDWITTACMIRYVRLADPDLMPPGRFPALDAVSVRCEALAAFKATWPADYAVPAAG